MALADKISNRTVKVYTDNQNVVKIVKSGSMKKDLHDIACKIFFFCIKNQITLEVEWIPRDQNNEADCYSKIFDFAIGLFQMLFLIFLVKSGDLLI